MHIDGDYGHTRPRFDIPVTIAERRGCDASPIDPCTEDGRLTLQSYVWPDQLERFGQLAAAIEVAHRVPAQVEKANAADWVETVLEEQVVGVATVLYHSIVWQYLSEIDRARVRGTILERGEAATHECPLAWLRLEPANSVANVRLQLWPGGEDRLLARSGFHGKPVRWLGVQG